MGDLSPSLRPAGVYTHLYTTFNRIRLKPNQIKRSISMCQALRQRSIRAITKLTRYIHTFSMDGYFLYFCSLYKNFF